MNLYQSLIEYTPQWSRLEIQWIVILLLVGLAAAWRLLRARKIVWSQAVSGFCLLIALLMIFGTTVLTRASGEEVQWQIRLFWSWQLALAGNREMLQEILLNVLLLLPVGVLLPLTLRRRLSWRQGLLIGVLISAMIELGQLFWRRGLFELDDILHNGVGCMLGCLIGSWCAGRWKR